MKKLTLLLFAFLIGQNAFSQDTATYSVIFESNWSQATHPHPSGNLPNTAHWSKLVGATHNSDITFLELGGIATQGIENVAEQGSNGVFFGEVNAAISGGTALELIDGPDLSTALGTITIDEINASTDFPYLTLTTMIAPSPDWLITISNVDLLNPQGYFKDEIIIDVYPIDAGTDAGVDYTSSNNDITPHGPISSLDGVLPFSSEKMGTVTISLIEVVLGIDTIENKSAVVFPNPTNGELNISFPSTQLKSIELYNALGAKVISFNNINSSSKRIDISNLASGIYLVRALDNDNNESIKKIVKL